MNDKTIEKRKKSVEHIPQLNDTICRLTSELHCAFNNDGTIKDTYLDRSKQAYREFLEGKYYAFTHKLRPEKKEAHIDYDTSIIEEHDQEIFQLVKNSETLTKSIVQMAEEAISGLSESITSEDTPSSRHALGIACRQYIDVVEVFRNSVSKIGENKDLESSCSSYLEFESCFDIKQRLAGIYSAYAIKCSDKKTASKHDLRKLGDDAHELELSITRLAAEYKEDTSWDSPLQTAYDVDTHIQQCQRIKDMLSHRRKTRGLAGKINKIFGGEEEPEDFFVAYRGKYEFLSTISSVILKEKETNHLRDIFLGNSDPGLSDVTNSFIKAAEYIHEMGVPEGEAVEFLKLAKYGILVDLEDGYLKREISLGYIDEEAVKATLESIENRLSGL